ncbi:MAG: DUF1553 domain-containing protein [Acidobacteria bacterium]|nr:DUF1553 domain-containing protein [Acidobacteriota bacterium]
MKNLSPYFRLLVVGISQAVLAQSIVVSVMAAPLDSKTALTDFNQKVRPLLETHCSECHSGRTKTSGFSVATLESVMAGGNKHGKAILEGHPESSPLVKLLKGELAPSMPLGKSLAEADISLIEAWIRNLSLDKTAGVKEEQWLWPFQKPLKHEVPVVKNATWVLNPIDAFIMKRLEEKGLPPAPPASKRVLARRLYFDLIGMPPSPEEMRTFLEDQSLTAYDQLINKLLADPRYGERWGRHWLDLVRFAESNGLGGDPHIGNVWRYRDWVIEAFNSDMTYDKFVIQQLAGGDEHSKTKLNYKPDIQGHIPLAFLRLAPWSFLCDPIADQNRQIFLDEITTTTASVFQGITMGCARCHDHKYDPIPSKDYYRFQAFFNATKISFSFENEYSKDRPVEKYLEVPFKDKTFAELADSKVKDYQKQLDSGPEKLELEELEKALLRKLVSQKMTEAKDRALEVTDLRLELKRRDQKIFIEAEQTQHALLLEAVNRREEDAREILEALNALEKSLLKKLVEGYANHLTDPLGRFQELTVDAARAELGGESKKSKYFSLTELEKHQELSDKLEVIKRRIFRWKPLAMTVENVPGPPGGPGIPSTRVLMRGNYLEPGEAVEPGFPSAITGNFSPAEIETDRYRQFPTRGRRMTLAKWITSPDNPLTARVMVNRIWQQHFGRGIVETASDFGKNGSRPTHPELLDWLAIRFIEEKWSIKAIHRLILTSNTYRQSSDNPTVLMSELDPDNRLVWRFNRRRLEAEALRDSILFISGRLNAERGGPSVFPPLPDAVADLGHSVPIGGLMWEPNEKEEDSRRRSVYIFQRRSLPLPMMASFDATIFSESCERRSVTTTPLQALSMMNGSLVNEASGYLATRAEQEAGPDRSKQISRLFQIVLSRLPQPEELQKFSKFSGTLQEISSVFLNSNELLYVD